LDLQFKNPTFYFYSDIKSSEIEVAGKRLNYFHIL